MCIGTSVPAHHANIVTARIVHATPACVLSAQPLVRKRQRRRRRERKNSKPKKPKRPKTAYNYFQLAEKQRLIGNSGRTSAHNELFARNIGQRWKSLSDIERQQYQIMADQDKMRYERENLEYIRSIAGEGKVSKEEQASVAGNKRPIDAPTGSGPKKAKLESSIPELIDWSPPSTPSQDTGLSTPTEFAGDSKPWPDDLLVTDLKDYEPRLLEANPQPQKLEAKDFPTLSGLDDFGFDSLLRADAEYPPNLFDAALDTSPLGTALW